MEHLNQLENSLPGLLLEDDFDNDYWYETGAIYLFQSESTFIQYQFMHHQSPFLIDHKTTQQFTL
ncbi:MAG TPA: hypothetical protein PLS50_03000 [Candidatus Dojkabacteria bacterium]|nr:hypothetical protein [Candidatus Dojkabacteria bacterium]